MRAPTHYLTAAVLLFVLAALLTYAHADPGPVTVRGEVVMVTGELCVVRDGTGKGVMMHVDKQTRVQGEVKAGAKVEAVVSPDGRALAIKALP